MESFVNIPTSEWRKLCNDIVFLKESMKVIATIKPVEKEWITEKEAMALLGIKDYRTMRKYAAKYGINISATTDRAFKYKASDIHQFLHTNSTIQK